MASHVQELISTGAERTDRALERLLPSPDTAPHSIHRAMRHSVFAGGKRLRPVLCFEAWRLASQHGPSPISAELAAVDLGAAIEMLHTYSLIHDDLPALDNDDLRRGQPTCHKVFGDAIAILAGDALQTLAFHTIARLDCPAITTIDILKEIASAVGTGVGPTLKENEFPSDSDLPAGQAPGMIGGQVLDIESEGKRQDEGPDNSQTTQRQPPTADLVEQIHRAKTGALITVSIVSGGHVAGASHDTIDRLRTFGQNAGLAFQIVDDVLDITQESAQLGKTAGKDTAVTKATWPAVFGVDRSLKDAQQLIADAFAALAPFGPAASNLKAIAQYLIDRTH
jgi:geranylgeranyl diphosphate synthase type II